MKNKNSNFLKVLMVTLTFFLATCKKETTPDDKVNQPISSELGFVKATNQQLSAFQVAPTLSLSNLPKVWLSLPMPPVGNQLQQGSCTSWATAYAVNGYFKHLREFTNYQYSNSLLSPSYVYSSITNGSCTGTSYPDNFNVMIQKGCCTLEDLPYNDISCNKSNDNTLDQKASLNKLLKFELVNKNDITNLKSILYSGFPIMIAIDVDASFDNLKSPFILKQKSGSVRGGHAIVVVGYDDNLNAFKVQNSWGENWGDNGFFWIDYDFFPTAVIGSECYIAYPQSGNSTQDQIAISLSGDMNFGNVEVSKSLTRTLKISCSGNKPLVVSSIVLPNGFSGSFTGVIQPNSNQDINITFSPSQAMTFPGILTVNANQTSGTNTIAIIGTGSGSTNNITNVAKGKTGTASLGGNPSYAFDGNLNTAWNAGNYAPQWISVNLQKSYSISKIKLLPSQNPNCNSTYEIFITTDLTNWTSIDKFTIFSTNNIYIERNFTSEYKNVIGVKVQTLSSLSWIAWLEIEIYGY